MSKPQIGHRVRYQGQVYELIRRVPYTRQDGKQTTLAVWQSACAECGAGFEMRVPDYRAASSLQFTRRCKLHAQRGKRLLVKYKAPRVEDLPMNGDYLPVEKPTPKKLGKAKPPHVFDIKCECDVCFAHWTKTDAF